MSRRLDFTEQAWTDYLYWQKYDKKVLQKINGLLAEATRTPFEGSGKPEPLRQNYAGFWSRRITKEHRLVYKVTDSVIQIIGCRWHYDK